MCPGDLDVGTSVSCLALMRRDSKLTMLLRESLGNINCRTTMIAHISDSPAQYTETLTTLQLASRIHRMRKKKAKVSHIWCSLGLIALLQMDACFSVTDGPF